MFQKEEKRSDHLTSIYPSISTYKRDRDRVEMKRRCWRKLICDTEIWEKNTLKKEVPQFRT